MLDEPTARKVKLGGCPLRSAALTRMSLRRFWSSSLIDGQKMAGVCPLDKLHTSVSCPNTCGKIDRPELVVSYVGICSLFCISTSFGDIPSVEPLSTSSRVWTGDVTNDPARLL